MKEIKAFVKPNRIQRVIEALSDKGFKSMTLSQAEGTGAFKAKGAKPSLDFHVTDSPVVKVELVCQNEEAQSAIDIITENGKTHRTWKKSSKNWRAREYDPPRCVC